MMIDATLQLAPMEQQFLHELRDIGWNDTEVRELGRAWAVANADIEAVVGKTEHDPLQQEIRVATIAAQINHAINVRLKVGTPAITKAKPDELLDWIDFYHAEAERLYRAAVEAQNTHPDGRAHGNPVFDEAHAQFHRICGFLWEANEQAGVNKLMQHQTA